MNFSELKVGEQFFESITGEYHVKLSDTTSVIIDIDTGKKYGECVFPSDHPIELPE